MKTMNTQMDPNPEATVSVQPMALDHDLHIHSQLSLCSSDPAQTPARILQYAKENRLTLFGMHLPAPGIIYPHQLP